VPLPEDLLAEVETDLRQTSPGSGAALQGTVWTALGLGMLAAGRLVRRAEFGSDVQQFLSFLEVWAYPATFVGVGLLIFAFFSRGKRKP
jgi:MYXO-CTERM domain-containing protein